MSQAAVTLIIDGIPFTCSKDILMSSSHYFNAMFGDHFVEKDKSVVHIKDVNPDSVQTILNYIIDDDDINWQDCNPLELLRTSSILQFDQIQAKCLSFILDTWLTIETCLSSMFIADELGVNKLYKQSSIMSKWEFDKIITTKSFLLITFEQLCTYLSMDDLNISNEFSIFDAIQLWINHDFNNRCHHINTLLECIHFSDMTIIEINDMLFYACIHESEYARSLLNCIKNIKIDKNYICTDESLFITAKQFLEKNERMLPVRSFIFACISKSKLNLNDISNNCNKMKDISNSCNKMKLELGFQPVILYHDTIEDTLKIAITLEKMCDIPDSVVGHQVIPIGQEIWVLGGEYQMGKGDWNMSVWKFNTMKKRWAHETCLPTPRRHHSVVHLNNELYVIGGVGRFRVMLETVDRYNLSTKVWEKCTNLPSCGYLMACCAHKGCVYVFHGNRVLLMRSPLYTWEVVGSFGDSINVDIAMSFKQYIYFTESSKSKLFKLNVSEEGLPTEDLGHFQVQSSNKTCLINNVIYHWSEDEDIITLETYDIMKREFQLRWSKHRDEFDEQIHLNRTSGCFTMLTYD